MAQHLVELCTILIEESFGDVAALIWSHLAEHGRIQFSGLLTLARVTPKELSRCLPILISNRAVVYHIDPDYNATWYSVDIEGTYNLLRMSKLGDVVKQRCGKDAAHIITNMAQLGHVTVGELTKIFGVADELEDIQSATNGTTTESLDNTTIKTIDQLHTALLQLVKAGFLIKASSRLFHTDYDVLQTLEKAVQEEHFPDGKVTGPKASHMFAQAVNSQKRKQRDDDVVPGITDSHPSKRQKLNGTARSSRQLSDDLVLSVNMKKYVMALRSKSYVRLATPHLGQSSATVYDYLLRTLERQLTDVTDGQLQTDENATDDEDEEDCFATATAANLYDIIDPSIDFTTSMKVPTKDLPSLANGKAAGYVQVQEDFSSIGIKQEHDSDDDGVAELSSYQNRAKLLELIERHLQSLEEHSRRFCHRQGQGKPAVWTVNFRSLTEAIIMAELDATIEARFGKPAIRLLRLLRDKGKLEEKQIAANAFMQMKDVRQILSELYGAGYVEAQELAKDQTRQPAKALYLWYFDAPKVQRMLIHQCYQAMSRLYQRLAAERVRYKEPLRKMRQWNGNRLFGDNYARAQREVDSRTKDPNLLELNGQAAVHAAENGVSLGNGIGAKNDLVKQLYQQAGVDEDGNPVEEAREDNDEDEEEADEDEEAAEDDVAAGDERLPADSNDDNAAGTVAADTTLDTINGNKTEALPDLDKPIAPPTKYVLGQSGVWRMDALHSYDKDRVKQWRAIESNYLGQIMRLDDLVVLLRDFDGRHPITSA